MQDQSASRTALITAYLRAAHQIIDSGPRILDDPVALHLLGPEAEKRIRSSKERLIRALPCPDTPFNFSIRLSYLITPDFSF